MVVVVAGGVVVVVGVAAGGAAGGAVRGRRARVCRVTMATRSGRGRRRRRGGGRVVVVVVVTTDGDASRGVVGRPVRRRSDGHAGAAACLGRPWCGRRGAPAVATSSAIRPSDTARITHQFGRPRATRERRPSPASGPPPTTGTRYARVTPSALGASGAQAALTAVASGVEGAAVASGQGGQLGHGVAQDVVGVEDLDLVGSHPLAVQVDEEAGQLLEVGLRRRATGSDSAGPGSSGTRSLAEVLRPEELAPERDSGWRRAGRGRRRGGPGRTIPAARARSSRGARRRTPRRPAIRRRVPTQLPGHRDQAREQGLDQHPAEEGVGVGLPEQDPDQAGRLLALDPARGAPHVLDEVARRGTRRRVRASVPRTRRARPGSRPGHVPERPDGSGGTGRSTAIRRPSGR